MTNSIRLKAIGGKMKNFLLLVTLLLFVPHKVQALEVVHSLCGGTITQSDAVTAANSISLLSANANRRCLIIVNKSDVTVYVTFASGGGATEGIPIPPGGNYEPDVVVSNAIYVRAASSSSKSVLAMEGIY